MKSNRLTLILSILSYRILHPMYSLIIFEKVILADKQVEIMMDKINLASKARHYNVIDEITMLP